MSLVLAFALSTIPVPETGPQRGVVRESALEWQEMFPGVSFAPVYGDWQEGAHGKYVRIAQDADVPMHWHTGDYRAVLISGRMVNIVDEGQRVALSPGDYFHMESGRFHSHECLSAEGCLFYTHSDSAWDIQVPGR